MVYTTGIFSDLDAHNTFEFALVPCACTSCTFCSLMNCFTSCHLLISKGLVVGIINVGTCIFFNRSTIGPSVKESTTGSNCDLSRFSTRLSKCDSPPPICPWRMHSSTFIFSDMLQIKRLPAFLPASHQEAFR